MVTKYYCDGCGDEYEHKKELSTISLVSNEWGSYGMVNKTLKSWPDRCSKCKAIVLAEAGISLVQQ